MANHTHDVNKKRRWLLKSLAGIAGTAWAGTTSARLLFQNVEPEEEHSGEPVEVDISKLEPGQLVTVTWRGKPVWILRRTEDHVADLPSLEHMLTDPHSTTEQQPEYARNPLRSIHPEVVVLLGICTHLGCTPEYRPDTAPEGIDHEWRGGFLCPCHGSRYDLAGRVFKDVPAPANLEVPPHYFITDSSIMVGLDSEVLATETEHTL